MKLITKAIEKQLVKNPLGCDNKKCLVKFFTPWGANTWWVTEAEQQDSGDWLFHGMVTLDGQFAEWGGFRLSDLQSLRGPFQLKIERDMYYNESEWLRDLERFGFGG